MSNGQHRAHPHVGPLGVRPHYRFGDLVINAEAIVDVFNAKTIDPEDLSKTVILLPSTDHRL